MTIVPFYQTLASTEQHVHLNATTLKVTPFSKGKSPLVKPGETTDYKAILNFIILMNECVQHRLNEIADEDKPRLITCIKEVNQKHQKRIQRIDSMWNTFPFVCYMFWHRGTFLKLQQELSRSTTALVQKLQPCEFLYSSPSAIPQDAAIPVLGSHSTALPQTTEQPNEVSAGTIPTALSAPETYVETRVSLQPLTPASEPSLSSKAPNKPAPKAGSAPQPALSLAQLKSVSLKSSSKPV